MTVISKILPIRFNTYFDWQRGKTDPMPTESVIEILNEADVKPVIVDLLFAKGTLYNYLLVSWEKLVYRVERDSEKSYVKQPISYHPVMERVKL